MATRHEEKFIIDYAEYSRIRARAEAALAFDEHAPDGGYTITSIYYDDRFDHAWDEKEDGVRVHTKFRVRTYDANGDFIRLERKIKRGIMTEKLGATLTREKIALLSDPNADVSDWNEDLKSLALQMRSLGLYPAVTVRYRRDAFVFPETDTRLTFDTNIEALFPNEETLFSLSEPGISALPKNQAVMEVKYGEYLPAFIRKLSSCTGKQLSVSKYALCRTILPRT